MCQNLSLNWKEKPTTKLQKFIGILSGLYQKRWHLALQYLTPQEYLWIFLGNAGTATAGAEGRDTCMDPSLAMFDCPLTTVIHPCYSANVTTCPGWVLAPKLRGHVFRLNGTWWSWRWKTVDVVSSWKGYRKDSCMEVNLQSNKFN